jgi:hypothetical protein
MRGIGYVRWLSRARLGWLPREGWLNGVPEEDG